MLHVFRLFSIMFNYFISFLLCSVRPQNDTKKEPNAHTCNSTRHMPTQHARHIPTYFEFKLWNLAGTYFELKLWNSAGTYFELKRWNCAGIYFELKFWNSPFGFRRGKTRGSNTPWAKGPANFPYSGDKIMSKKKSKSGPRL